jgi:hypothetical protein
MRLEKLIPIALTSGENIIIQFNNKRVGVCFEQKSGIILKGEQKDLEELISIVLNKTMSHQEFSMN